ncbi:helix-turn-helix domain-containing protein [Sphingobacterium sp. E70]|uniref:helix-turn-helix domain-containing protein n=1 Tax=Sphingobacterium sp. E70 TaxID=2853439 RepID=UPI00211CFAF4|nr:helix-turn-helix domain-containing protein [Sphingobacterium sp. E70]ULT26851.1 helix-turn-helix domain-containing protein [Sphingobacterium sp. E70]
MTTGTKIRLLREQKGWGQDVLAAELGISQPAISKLESDQNKLSWDNAVKLGELFEVDPEYFFETKVFNHNTNTGEGNQVISPQTYHESDIELLKSIYEDHLKTKNELLEERYERIVELKKQVEELKAELANLKKV